MARSNNSILQGPLFLNIVTYTIPIILTSILQLLFNAADLVIVGRFCGSVSVAAVGATGSITNLIVNLFIGLSVGAGVAVARAYGSKDDVMVHRTVHTAIPTAIVGGIVLTFVGVLFSEEFLRMMDTPENVLALSSVYMKIYFGGITFSMIYNFCSSILRAVGDTKSPLLFLSIAGVVNVVLNVFFVTVFNMNVAGVALATVISQYVSAALLLWHMLKTDSLYKLEKIEFKFFKDKLSKIVAIGIPNAVHGVVISISNVFIQSSLNSFDSIAVTGSSAAANIETYVYHIQSSFHQAGLTFVGQNYGAGKFDRIKKTQRCCYFLVITLGLTFGILAYVFGEPLLSIYIKDGPHYAETVAFGLERMLCICVPYFLCGIIEVQTGLLCGLGKSVSPSVITVFGFCAVRLIWIATMVEKYHTLTMLYACYPVSWLISMILLYFVYLRAKHQLFPKNYKEIRVLRRKKTKEA